MFVGLDKVSEQRQTIIPKLVSSGNDSTNSFQKKKSVDGPSDQKMEFEVGDRVMAFDDYGGTIYGTVRWTGGGAGRMGKIVGIETVSSLQDFIRLRF